jgi:hypothetical protein
MPPLSPQGKIKVSTPQINITFLLLLRPSQHCVYIETVIHLQRGKAIGEGDGEREK